ncbi:MAG: prepilin peptidase [bacterium]|jgi:leader peptidase (prepilin peptidase)/N-methyltransferase
MPALRVPVLLQMSPEVARKLAIASLAEPLIYAALAVFGLIMGSFANVLIWRLPRGEEVVRTPSHCPICGKPVRWYDNIPVLSWLILGGKCRDCRGAISVRYPLVEAGTMLVWLGTYRLATGAGYELFPALIIAACAFVLFLVFVIDLETYLIPDQLVWWGIVLAAALIFSGESPSGGWISAIIGYFALSLLLVIIGMIGNAVVFPKTFREEGGPLVLLAWLWYLATFPIAYPVRHFLGKDNADKDEVLDAESATAEQSAMGGGDIKLATFMGLLLGWKLLIAAFAYAVLAGGIVGAGLLVAKMATGRYKRGLKLQFGPFLALGCFAAIFWGADLITWYLRFTHIAAAP